jgi:hypothetical protein
MVDNYEFMDPDASDLAQTMLFVSESSFEEVARIAASVSESSDATEGEFPEVTSQEIMKKAAALDEVLEHSNALRFDPSPTPMITELTEDEHTVLKWMTESPSSRWRRMVEEQSKRKKEVKEVKEVEEVEDEEEEEETSEEEEEEEEEEETSEEEEEEETSEEEETNEEEETSEEEEEEEEKSSEEEPANYVLNLMKPGNPTYLRTSDLRKSGNIWPRRQIYQTVSGLLQFECVKAKFNHMRKGSEVLLFKKSDAEKIVANRLKIIEKRKQPQQNPVKTPASEKKANEKETSEDEEEEEGGKKKLWPPFRNNVEKLRKRKRKNYVRREDVTFEWKDINQYKCHFCDYTSRIKKRDNVARHMCCKHGCTILNKKGCPKDYRETLARTELKKRRKNNL